MDVFISWSGPLARDVAETVNWLLRRTIQGCRIFVSETDINKGDQWSTTITAALDSATFGIIVVTNRNWDAPWLHFEAGALSRSLGDAGDRTRVAPLLVDVPKTALSQTPLGMFQMTTADQPTDVLKLLNSIAKMQGDGYDAEVLAEVFGRFSDEYLQLLADAVEVHGPEDDEPAPGPPKVDVETVLADLVDAVRSIENRLASELPPSLRFVTRTPTFEVPGIRLDSISPTRPRRSARERLEELEKIERARHLLLEYLESLDSTDSRTPIDAPLPSNPMIIRVSELPDPEVVGEIQALVSAALTDVTLVSPDATMTFAPEGTLVQPK